MQVAPADRGISKGQQVQPIYQERELRVRQKYRIGIGQNSELEQN